MGPAEASCVHGNGWEKVQFHIYENMPHFPPGSILEMQGPTGHGLPSTQALNVQAGCSKASFVRSEEPGLVTRPGTETWKKRFKGTGDALLLLPTTSWKPALQL